MICLANSTTEVPLRLDLTETEMENYGVKNVSRRFNILFKSGFWILNAYLILAIVWATCFRNKTKSAFVVKTLLFVVLVIQLGHFITSNIYRFDHEGKVCSGDDLIIPANITNTTDFRLTSRFLMANGFLFGDSNNTDACKADDLPYP